jgi:Ca-activated chloride channel family protein
LHHPKRLTLTVLASVTGLLISATPAIAEANAPAPEFAPTMLVLDASGSMAAAAPGGGTKMDAAKRATRTLVDAVPEGAPVGLAVYGTNTGSSDAEKQAGCTDVSVLRGPEPIDRAALTSAVDGLSPRGYTPIGEALRKADDALPDAGPRSIVLVSDGVDTCAPPDPCEVAKELSSNGTDLVVHTVGFGVDEAAREQLTCIAQQTGGTYTDAPDAGSLEHVLPRVTGAALRNYQPGGTPVTGTTSVADAPDLAPGQYLDVLAKDQRKYYAVDVPAGNTVYFTATTAYARVDSGMTDVARFEVEMFAPDGSECGVRDRSVTTFAADGEVVTASVVWDGTGNQLCDEPGRYLFGVHQGVNDQQPAQLPVEILVGLEPAVTGDKGPPATDEPVVVTEQTGPGQPVVGGGSFTTAATLVGSGVYSDTLRLREFVFYRVRLEWGQAVAYRVQYGESSFDSSVNVSTSLYSPFRTEVDSKTTGYHGRDQLLGPLATPPVNYLNREEVNNEGVSVAGWFYLAVKVGRDLGDDYRDDLNVPVRLEVSITGAAEDGPDYAGSDGSGTFGQDAPQSEPRATGVTRTKMFPLGWVLGGAGAGLVLVAMVGAVLAIRRRAA